MISFFYGIFCMANFIMSLIWMLEGMFGPAAICVATALFLAGVAIEER